MNQPSRSRVSFQEFALYYQTTEQVTERRLAMNRWNYSISAATLVAIGLVLNWSIGQQSRLFVGAVGITMLCLLGAIMCTYWINQISDGKALNAAKFGVLSQMAPLVEFEGSSGPSGCVSFEPFDKEWSHLTANQALTTVSTGRLSRLVVLNASKAEFFIPKAFRVLFAVILLATLTFAAVEHDNVFRKINPFSSVGEYDDGTKVTK